MASPGRRERGLTLIELLVAAAVGLAVLAVLGSVYLGSRAAYRTNEALARVQESGRLAIDWIARDLRSAGFAGCLSRGAQITVYSNPPPLGQGSLTVLRGYERGAGFAYPPGVERPAGVDDSDAVRFVAVDAASRARLDGESDVAAATIPLRDNDARFETDDVLVVSDCQRAAVFTVTGVRSRPIRLVHAADRNGGLDTPTHRISPPFKARDGAFVARFDSVAYFIGRSKDRKDAPPSLYRASFERTERLAENVEDLDFLYGVDNDDDGAVDAYLRADQLGAAQWDRVLSVRVAIVVASAQAAASGGAQAVRLRDVDGDTVIDAQPAAADRRLRQVFATTVSLRNRLQ